MDKLKGFLLVTKGHTGGDQLCFRFPNKKEQMTGRDKASDPLPVGEDSPAVTKGYELYRVPTRVRSFLTL